MYAAIRAKISKPVVCRNSDRSLGVANGANHFRHPEADYTAAPGNFEYLKRQSSA